MSQREGMLFSYSAKINQFRIGDIAMHLLTDEIYYELYYKNMSKII